MDSPLIAEALGPLESPTSFVLYSVAPGSFWSSCALLLTAVAAAVGILLSCKLHLSRLRSRKTLIRLPSFYSSGSDDDDASTTSSSDDYEEETDEMEEGSEDFGNETANLSFSLADLVGGMGVVKAWDGLGLGLDRSGGAVSFFDMSRGEILRSFDGGAGETTAVQLASPAEIVAAADEAGGGVVRVWDVREGGGAAAAAARPLLRRRVAGLTAREGKVLVGDEGGEVAALDLRNLAQVEGGEGLGSWWRSAARCLTLLSPRLQNA